MIDAKTFFLQTQFNFTSPHSFWFFWSSLLQSGSEFSGTGFEMQLLISAWLLFSLIIITSYTANLIVFLAAKTPYLPFTNVHQVINNQPLSA